MLPLSKEMLWETSMQEIISDCLFAAHYCYGLGDAGLVCLYLRGANDYERRYLEFKLCLVV